MTKSFMLLIMNFKGKSRRIAEELCFSISIFTKRVGPPRSQADEFVTDTMDSLRHHSAVMVKMNVS